MRKLSIQWAIAIAIFIGILINGFIGYVKAEMLPEGCYIVISQGENEYNTPYWREPIKAGLPMVVCDGPSEEEIKRDIKAEFEQQQYDYENSLMPDE